MNMADFQAGYLITILLTCLISSILITKFYKYSRVKPHLPPAPFRLPIIGHLHLLAPIPHQAFHKLSMRHGPLFQIFIGSTPCVVASSSQTAKEILKTHENAFLDRPHNALVDYFAYGGKGFIFTPYGTYWKFLKKIIMSELLNGKKLESLYPVRHDEINQFIRYLSQKAKDGESVELEGELMKLTSNVISRLFMSKRFSKGDEESDNLTKMITEIAEITGKLNFSDHMWFCKNLDLQGFGKISKDVHSRYDELMEKIMREHEDARKQKKVKVDLLNVLLDISEDESMEIKLTRENIKALIREILGAGTDTSAITIVWALAELINHPNIMRKAVEEIDQVVGTNRLLQESDIPNLPYLQAIVNESLRLHPPAPLILRLSTQDCIVGGYHIPYNTTTMVNAWSLGRDPMHWESPLEFKPERFEGKPHVDVRGQHFNLLPFGTGRRMCPGASLGLHMVHVTLGAMIQCFEWKAGENGNLARVDMEEGVGITLPRANPLVCVPVARLDLISLHV